MARPLRVEYPGAVYHVISRGNAGEDIYRNNADRNKCLSYLAKAVERFALKIHTYCLMQNHFHLLLETDLPNLSRSMQWILLSYAAYFNRKYKRRGHLFYGRFKSILVDADAYLKQLSRYIHLNPVRAGLVAQPDLYQWSSYPVFAGKVKAPPWLETNWLLAQFGKNEKEAIGNYKGFVEKIDAIGLPDPQEDLVGGFLLGAPEFIKWVQNTFLADRSDDREITQLRRLKPSVTPNMVIKAVCEDYECEKTYLIKKGRKRNTARDTAIYLARELSATSGKDLAEYFGFATGSGITSRCSHITKRIENDKIYKRRVKRIKSKILNNTDLTPKI